MATLSPAALARLLVRAGEIIAGPVDDMCRDQRRDDSAHAAARRLSLLVAAVVGQLGPGVYTAMVNACDHLALDPAAEDALDAAVSDLTPPEQGAVRGMQTLLREWKTLSASREHRHVVAATFDSALLKSMSAPGGEIGQ